MECTTSVPIDLQAVAATHWDSDGPSYASTLEGDDENAIVQAATANR